jgi:hypothetical protein
MPFISNKDYGFVNKKTKIKEIKFGIKVYRFVIDAEKEELFEKLKQNLESKFAEYSKKYNNVENDQIFLYIIFDLIKASNLEESDFIKQQLLSINSLLEN